MKQIRQSQLSDTASRISHDTRLCASVDVQFTKVPQHLSLLTPPSGIMISFTWV